MRRPIISLVLAGGLLIAATVPYFDINTGTSGVSELPDDYRAKQGYEVLRAEFGFGLNAPAEIVIDADIESDAVQGAIAELTASLESDPGFGPSTLTGNQSGDLGMLSVPLLAGPATVDGIESIRKLRDEYIPEAFSGVAADVLVTGATAQEVDAIDLARRYLPIEIALVLTLSFVLLTLAFRSIVVPIKAIIQGDHHESAVGGCSLPHPGPGLAERGWQRALRLPPGGRDPGVDPRAAVRYPVRAVDGLPGVSDKPHPGAVPSDRRQRRGRGLWTAVYRRTYHRSGVDHGGDIRRILGRRPGAHGSVRVRHGRCDPAGRDNSPVGARPIYHEATGRSELVPARLSQLAASLAGGR
uniref:Membrane transport protein MMPL domain-containing protein n=1 Tax=uncultured marine microorganism HF4000_APKG8C21 TaxID=455553 RepID=B3TA34_9ZZZZ|nr:hypothetical protein ALOHA_HF4000APKG8C21ctg1g31 [uncultured marine microorganism HF4000_APKG8C21]